MSNIPAVPFVQRPPFLRRHISYLRSKEKGYNNRVHEIIIQRKNIKKIISNCKYSGKVNQETKLKILIKLLK